MSAITVMPRLVGHNVVEDAGFLDGVGDLTEDLGVPSLIQPVDVILAEHVEVVLILRNDEVVGAEQGHEFVQDPPLAESAAVDEENARVEEGVAGDAKHLFHVGAVFVDLNHCLLMAGAHVGAPDIGQIHFADIALHDRVTVNVDRLVIFGEHLGDEQAEIGGLGVVIPNG